MRRNTPKSRTTKLGPVARVWAIASKMSDAPRKDIIAACLNAGVNKSTAATQVQRFRHASPGDKARMLETGSLREPPKEKKSRALEVLND